MLAKPWLLLLLAMALIAGPSRTASALIMGGVGNEPIRDPGWPAGAAVMFNTKARIAWWEGPPFGGGEWHAECRGDAEALNTVLAHFAKLDVKTKRLIVRDGMGQSFWLNSNDEPSKTAAARMDWSFTVWQPASWQRLSKMPADIGGMDPVAIVGGPPAEIEVFTGGNVQWDRVAVPAGITIDDQRLVAHGFSPADGTVLQGRVTDLARGKPLAAGVRVERVEPHAAGGYGYSRLVETVAARNGRWTLTRVPSGWVRVVAEARGYVPRVIGYARYADQPGWNRYDAGLARSGRVDGRVLDAAGRPLDGVQVRIQDVVANPGVRYESPHDYSVTTGADGRFRADQVPVGTAAVWVWKTGYSLRGLGPQIQVPQHGIVLTMRQAAQVEVTVDFGGKERPGGYIVQMHPEGGDKAGTYGGSGQIDASNQMVFKDVPPGRYMLTGQPNPGSASQRTEPVAVDLKGGETTRVRLTAK